jgi:ABC-2 type transport system ATP-binding protein
MTDEQTPIVQVRDLVKRYEKADVNAVDGITFDVGRGEFFALLGPNGAGKTTTISVLTTTLLPTSGRAVIAGHDVMTDAAAVRRSAGIIFQKPSLDQNLTAEENVRFHAVLYGLYPPRPMFSMMPAAYKDRVGELAEVLGIEDAMFQPIRTFSGGMMRKLEIVRSLVHEPNVLFLDEPTTGLDPSSRRNLWSYLDDVRRDRGTTLFLTTHYLEEAEQADRICIIAHGRIVSLGSPADIKGDLVHDYVLVNADDRAALAAELDAMGIAFLDRSADGVQIDVRPAELHDLLRRIETPLSSVRTHTPSLEDAYMEIVERPAELEAQAEAEAQLWSDTDGAMGGESGDADVRDDQNGEGP